MKNKLHSFVPSFILILRIICRYFFDTHNLYKVSVQKVMLFCAIFSSASLLHSQGIINNGGYLVVDDAATVYISGGNVANYTSSAGGIIILDGTINIEGNWINNNTTNLEGFSNNDGIGWVKFIGTTTNQTIGGSSSKATKFESVEINRFNGASNSNINLSKDIEVQGQLKLTKGFITTGAYKVTMLSNIAADLSGFGTQSYINGNMRRYIATAPNSSTYTFPVGNGITSTNHYNRMDIVNSNLSPTTYLDVYAGYYTIGEIGGNNANNPSNFNTTQDGTSFANLAASTASPGNSVEWTSVPNVQPSSGSYEVRLYLNGLSGLADNKMCPLKRPHHADSVLTYAAWKTYNGTTIPASGQTGRTVAGGYVSRAGHTSFSRHGVGVSATILPIELKSFVGECKEDMMHLLWETASEKNNEYFTLERSTDGTQFSEIALVPGAGNSNQSLIYEYLYQNEPSSAYFKLKQTDYDGKTTYSDIIYVEGCSSKKEDSFIEAFTNNNKDILLKIRAQSEKEYFAFVLDQNGKTVVEPRKYYAGAGNNSYKIQTFGIATGIYILAVQSGEEHYTQRIYIK